MYIYLSLSMCAAAIVYVFHHRTELALNVIQKMKKKIVSLIVYVFDRCSVIFGIAANPKTHTK